MHRPAPGCYVTVTTAGFPLDKQERATETVFEQAALLSGEWVAA